MTIERSHGKARPTLPRLADVPEQGTAGEPNGQRDAKGRFTGGNKLATGRGWKHVITKGLGAELEGEAGELGNEAAVLFRAFMADLPCDAASVRQLVAARARAAVLSARYSRVAAQSGLDTPEGSQAASEALKWDARAERLAVTSMDVSVRLAKVAKGTPVDATPWFLPSEGASK